MLNINLTLDNAKLIATLYNEGKAFNLYEITEINLVIGLNADNNKIIYSYALDCDNIYHWFSEFYDIIIKL
jgi:hypothetical protein